MRHSHQQHQHEHNNSHEDHSHHQHHHTHEAKGKFCKLTKTQSFIIMLIMTTLFFFAEIVTGNLTKSNTLIADSFHMLSDVISLVIGLIAVRMSKKVSSRNTFGWVRAEVLGSLVNSVFLLALCFSIVLEAINRFINPEALERIDLMLIIAGIGLGINLIGLIIFGSHSHTHGHSHGSANSHPHEDERSGEVNLAVTNTNISENIQSLNGESRINNVFAIIEQIEVNTVEVTSKKKKTRSTKNMNIHGVFLHVLSDALGSITVLISGLIVKYAPPKDDLTIKWKLYIDPALSVIISIIITISAIPLLRDASLVLLQTVPRQFKIDELKSLIENVKGVLDVHHLHVWSLNSEKIIASAHICVNKQENGEELNILHEIKRLLHKNNIHSTTLQLEYDSNIHGHNYDFCEGQECRKRQCCTNEETKKLKIQNFKLQQSEIIKFVLN